MVQIKIFTKYTVYKNIKQRTMKQEIKEELDKILKKLTQILNACAIKNWGDVEQTLDEFNDAQVKMKNSIDKRIEELNLSRYEKEEIDKYYYSKMIDIRNYYLEN